MFPRNRVTFIGLIIVAWVAMPVVAQSSSRNSPSDTNRQRRIAELQSRLATLRQQLQSNTVALEVLQGDLARYDRALGAALYDLEAARGNHQSAIRAVQELAGMERQAAGTLDEVQVTHAQVYARLRKAMAEVPQLVEAKGQVEVARKAREESRLAVLEQLKASHEHYARLASQRREMQGQIEKLRLDAASPERDLAIQKLAQSVLELDGRLATIEQPALVKDGKFQEADAIFDSVAKRLNMVRNEVEEEARKHPDRIAVQQLLDDAKANLAELRGRSADARAEAEAQRRAAREREIEVARLQNQVAQRRADVTATLHHRQSIINDIARVQRELDQLD